MNNESQRHHYLPEFYIKKFCNEQGKIFIYDNTDKRNPDKIIPKSPSSIFFEWNRNTVETGSEKNTVIETIYRDIENKIAPHLSYIESIQSNNLKGEIGVETLRNLIYLGYLTKWRVPVIDDYLHELSNAKSFDELNIFAQVENELFLYISKIPQEFVKEVKRLVFPTLLFSDREKYAKVFKDTFILTFQEPLFLTDNPFVEFSPEKNSEFPSFIFPLTSHALLVYCDFIDKMEFSRFITESLHSSNFLKLLYNTVQITLMLNSKKYIGCKDDNFLRSNLSTIPETIEKLEKQGRFAPLIAFTVLANYQTFGDAFV